jgi:hypothetical protein
MEHLIRVGGLSIESALQASVDEVETYDDEEAYL